MRSRAVLGGMLLILPLFLQAQTVLSFRGQREDILENRSKIKFGPFRIYPRIMIRNIGYDGNVYRVTDEEEAQSDYTFTLSPSVEVNLLFRDWLIMTFYENPEYRHYFKISRERKFNNSYAPSFKLLLFRRFVLSTEFRVDNRRLLQSSEFDVPIDVRDESISARLLYETPRETMVGFSGSIRRQKYRDRDVFPETIAVSEALNREERAGQFEFYYRIFSQSQFFLTAEIAQYQFLRSGSSWRDSRSVQVKTGVLFPLLGRIQGRLSLGYKRLIPDIEGVKTFSGLVGDTDISFRYGGFTFSMAYSRDSRFSYGTSNIYFIEHLLTPGFSFFVSSFLRFNYRFSYGENRYPEEETVTYPGGRTETIRRLDTHRAHTFGFIVRVARRTGIGLSINLWNLRSNYYARGNRSRLYIGLVLTEGF